MSHYRSRLVELVALTTIAVALPAAAAHAVPKCGPSDPSPVCGDDGGDDGGGADPPPPAPHFTFGAVTLQADNYLYAPIGSGTRYLSAQVTINRYHGHNDPVTLGPLWLWEEDGSLHPSGDFMSFIPEVTIPAGKATTWVLLPFRCAGQGWGDGVVEGTATVDDAGQPNNPSSGEGWGPHWITGSSDPAEVGVSLGRRSRGPNLVSNHISIECYQPYYG